MSTPMKSYCTTDNSPIDFGWVRAHNIEGAVRQICGRRVFHLEENLIRYHNLMRTVFYVFDRKGNLVAEIAEY